MQPVPRQVGEGLGHEGGEHPGLGRQRVDHVAEHDHPVGRGQGVREAEVLLELPVGVLVVVGVVGPTEGVHVARRRGQVVVHPGQRPGVIAGCLRLVLRVRDLYPAPLTAAYEEVLGLGARLERVARLPQPLYLAAQDDPWGERPGLTEHVGIALDDPEPRAPRRREVRTDVGHRQYVRRGRDLTHRPGREAGEAGAVGQQSLESRSRHQFRARLSVHVHEHGEEELDSVAIDRRPELRGARDPAFTLGCDARHPHLPSFLRLPPLATMLP